MVPLLTLIVEVVVAVELQEGESQVVLVALVDLELRVLLIPHQHQELQVELVDLVQHIQVHQDQLIQELVVMVQDQAELH